MLSLQIEPLRNVIFGISGNYRQMGSASDSFSLDYIDPNSIASSVKQFETTFTLNYFPG